MSCCSICLNSIRKTRSTTELPCGHLYHKKCINDWESRGNDTCPLCRKYISTNVQSNINIVHVKNMTTTNKLLLILSVFTNLSFLSVHIFNLFR